VVLSFDDSDFAELGERGLEVFDDFLVNYVRIGEVNPAFEAFVFDPKDLEIEFVMLGFWWQKNARFGI